MKLFGRSKKSRLSVSKDYYLTVLASKASLPSLRLLANPKGEDGAISGLAAPLSRAMETIGQSKAEHEQALREPLRRGSYAVTSVDRKTVIRMLVMSPDESGFDPDGATATSLASKLDKEVIDRIKATWTIVQLNIEAFDPAVIPALSLLHRLADKLAVECDGVIADPVSERYFLPKTVFSQPLEQKTLADTLVEVHFFTEGVGSAYTLGMQKVGDAEIELNGLDSADANTAEAFLLAVANESLGGPRLTPGMVLGPPTAEWTVAVGGLDRSRWEGIPCVELLGPTLLSTGEALRAWKGWFEESVKK